MKKYLVLLSMLLTVLMALPIISQAAVPFATDDSETLAPGAFEVEIYGAYEQTRKEGITEKGTELGMVITAGIINGVDISAQFPYLSYNVEEESERGPGDISMTVKWNFMKEEDMPSLAVSGTVKLPTGEEEKGLGTGKADYSLYFIASREFGPFYVYGNIGYTVVGEPDGGEARNSWHFSLAAEYKVTDKLSLLAEVSKDTKYFVDDEDRQTVALGARWNISDSTFIDGGVLTGLGNSGPDWGVRVGVTFTF